MVVLRPTQRDDMVASHARQRTEASARSASKPAPSQTLNIETVLDLGNLLFFHFRGRSYGMPPLPWREGQRLLSVWLDASSFPSPLTVEATPKYFAAVAKIPAILWRNCFPASRMLRVLRRLGLLRNPWQRATEHELIGWANFFLSRRMRPGDSIPNIAAPTGARREMR